jgi:hypothetical protein
MYQERTTKLLTVLMVAAPTSQSYFCFQIHIFIGMIFLECTTLTNYFNGVVIHSNKSHSIKYFTNFKISQSLLNL